MHKVLALLMLLHLEALLTLKGLVLEMLGQG